MATWFKDEIEHVGSRLEKVIEKAAEEIHEQRSLTKADMEDLISFAAVQFGSALDNRIDKAKKETSELITSKLTEFRTQLSEAAISQKKAAVRNAVIGVVAAIGVSLISLVSRKYFAGGLSVFDVYRIVVVSIAAGYFAVLMFKLAKKYFSTPDITRNSVITGAAYLDILKPKGLGIHFAVLGVAILGWLMLSNPGLLVSLLHKIQG